MAGMYPDNETIELFGETVSWPGVDEEGKFTNGSFSDPKKKPSFIPAETVNLILDNLSKLLVRLGKTPNNKTDDQLATAVDEALAKRALASTVDAELAQKAPVAHASTSTTYGIANGGTYGHVRFPTGQLTDDLVCALPHKYQAANQSYDLNNFRTAGIYTLYYGNASGSANWPAGWGNGSGSSAILEVMPFYSNTAVRQILHKRSTNQVWVRYSNTATTWGEWQMLATLESPVFTGTPKAPTAAVKNNSTQIATTAYADRAGHPVGSFYTQYPVVGQSAIAAMFPSSESPATLFGGTWSEMYASEDVFFRTGALGANRGNVWDAGEFTTSGGVAGVQPDAERPVMGAFGGSLMSGIDEEGACSIDYSILSRVANVTSGDNFLIKYIFRSDRIVPTDSTNHPKNRLIKVWKRIV